MSFPLALEVAAADAATLATEGTYTLNEQHVLEGVNHLIEFFRNGPRNRAALEAALEEFQELEDALWELYSAFDPDTATGNALLLVGKLVGEPQLGRDDDEYRAAILVRVLVNACDGKAEQLYEIAINMLDWQEGVDFTVALTEYYPATINVEYQGSLGAVTLQNIFSMLKQAKGGGVKLGVTLVEDVGVDEFGAIWAEADGVDLARGWAYGTESDADQGGNYAQSL